MPLGRDKGTKGGVSAAEDPSTTRGEGEWTAAASGSEGGGGGDSMRLDVVVPRRISALERGTSAAFALSPAAGEKGAAMARMIALVRSVPLDDAGERPARLERSGVGALVNGEEVGLVDGGAREAAVPAASP